MVTLRNFISASFGLFLLTQCNTKKDNSTVTEILLPSAETLSEKLVTGEWKYSPSIWYSSELTLQDNGTFKFHDQGCYGQEFSQGKWANNDGTIVLTSFDTFKPKRQTETNKPNETTARKKITWKSKDDKIEISIGDVKNISLPRLPGPSDTIRIYFDRVQLQFRSDTLYGIDNDQFFKEIKFYRTGDNR
jgi:hypothetical protein